MGLLQFPGNGDAWRIPHHLWTILLAGACRNILGVALGALVLAPMAIFGPLTGTNNAVSSSAHFGVVGRIIGSFLSLLTARGILLYQRMVERRCRHRCDAALFWPAAYKFRVRIGVRSFCACRASRLDFRIPTIALRKQGIRDCRIGTFCHRLLCLLSFFRRQVLRVPD